MKSDWSRNFYTQIAVNIFYSALIACLVDAFLIMNINLLLAYLDQTRYANMMIFQIFRMGTITTILYVLIGIGVFSLTLLLLERKTMKYIGKIAMAIQNISEGDLNTQIEVVGDDEFSAMASNLNRMEADIRKLMDKERESERTKNELITNVAHDLRTPLTSIIGYLELLSSGPAISQEMQKKYIDIAYVKAKRLEKLIEDLFGFTKMNYGRISMNVGKVKEQCPVPGDHGGRKSPRETFRQPDQQRDQIRGRGKESPGPGAREGRYRHGVRHELRLCDPGGGAAADLQ